MTESLSIDDLVRRALDAYETLADLAEDVEDEWLYISEVTAAWRERIEVARAARGSEPADEWLLAAVDRLIDEVGRIADAHRAIDWLSTFPQVLLAAMGEQP